MLLIAGTVLGSMAVLLVGAIQQRRAALQTTADEAVLLSRLAAAQQERTIAVVRDMLQEVAERQAAAASPAALRGARRGPVRALAAVTPRGKVISSTDPREVGQDVSRTDWFRRAASRRSFVVGRHDAPPGDSASMVRCAEPVISDEGRLDAVVVATLDLAKLAEAETPASLDSQTTYMLVDRHGIVLVPSRPAGQAGDSIVAMRRALATGGWQQEVRGGDGRWRIVAFTPLRATGARGLYVGVGVDRDALSRKADRELQIGVVLMALFGIAVGLLSWQGAHAIVLRRVEAMLAMTRRLRRGDLAARTGLPYGSGELSDLSRALDAMAATLASDHAARARAELRLRLSDARTRAVLEASVDGIFVVDREGRIVECNETGLKMLGDSGRPERAVRGVTLQQALGVALSAVDAPQVVQSVLPRAEGEDLPVEIVLSPVRHFAAEGYVVATVRDVSERVRWERALEAQSLTDELTGLHNRRGFLALATQRMRLLARTGETAVLVSVDLDGLKIINDTFGHAEGDRALRELADVLRRSFRETDVIGRMGGDEFVVLATVGGDQGLGRALGRLANAFVDRNAVGDLPWLLRASVGWSRSPASANESLDALLARADRNMYRRKRARGVARPSAPVQVLRDAAATESAEPAPPVEPIRMNSSHVA